MRDFLLRRFARTNLLLRISLLSTQSDLFDTVKNIEEMYNDRG